jgi:hypothetical protein
MCPIEPPPNEFQDFVEILWLSRWGWHSRGKGRVQMRVATDKAWHQHSAVAIDDFITRLQGEIAANRNNTPLGLTQIPSSHGRGIKLDQDCVTE